LLEKPWQFFAKNIIQDLQKAHPAIEQQIESIDIWRWGHAMTYPQVGFLKNAERLMLNQTQNRLRIAHTDAAGISIFEEAFAQGVNAAQSVIRQR
jgi:hypothetical protein